MLGKRGCVEHDFVHAVSDLSVPGEKCDIVSESDRVDAARSDIAAAIFCECAVNESQSAVVRYRGDRCIIQQARRVTQLLATLPQAMLARTIDLVT